MFVAGGTMDGMSGGYAVMFLSFFLIICSFAVAFLFFTRAMAIDDILGRKDLLAHWVYPTEETQTSAEREYANYQESNRAMLFVIGGFLLIGMILMLLFGGEGGVLTAGILFVVLIIIAIILVVAPKLELKRALNAPQDAYITGTGIIYEGAVYPFHSFLMRMDGVSFVKGTPNRPPMLDFSFLQLVGLFILRPFGISVPVPAGEVKTAQEIERKLGGSVGEEEISGPETTKLPLYCLSCGVSLQPVAKFCRLCGKKIS